MSRFLVLLAVACGQKPEHTGPGPGPTDPTTPTPTPTVDSAPTDPTSPDTTATTATTAPDSGTPTAPTIDSATRTDTGLGPAPDFSQPGPWVVDRGSGSFAASCTMDYDTFSPQGHTPAAWVVLAHGFLRDRGPMEGIALHLASWGLAVVTPDVCHLELTDLDYEQNAADLVALGDLVGGGGPVLQAGHSAGALSSFLAATTDPRAVGHLGLDLVEFEGKGAAAAASMPVPSWGILGEPEICNLSGNAIDVYALVPDHDLVRVVGADHCDFEDPTDIGCTLACASGSGSSAVLPAIQGLAAAAALALTGEDPRGAQFWTPGEGGYDALLAAGVIEEP